MQASYSFFKKKIKDFLSTFEMNISINHSIFKLNSIIGYLRSKDIKYTEFYGVMRSSAMIDIFYVKIICKSGLLKFYWKMLMCKKKKLKIKHGNKFLKNDASRKHDAWCWCLAMSRNRNHKDIATVSDGGRQMTLLLEDVADICAWLSDLDYWR